MNQNVKHSIEYIDHKLEQLFHIITILKVF